MLKNMSVLDSDRSDEFIYYIFPDYCLKVFTKNFEFQHPKSTTRSNFLPETSVKVDDRSIFFY